MANREYYDVIIIGGGPAGLSAAIYALRASMRTVLIEKASPGGQITLTDEVENYPGFKNINGYDLSEKFLSHAKSYNLEVLSQEAAVLEPGLDWEEGTSICASLFLPDAYLELVGEAITNCIR